MLKTITVRLDEPLSGSGQKDVYFFADERSGPQQLGDGSTADQLLSTMQAQGFKIVDKTSRVSGNRRITDWKLSKDFQTPWG